MPHPRVLIGVCTVLLFAGAAMTPGAAQTARKPGAAAQGQVPPQILQQFDTNGNGQLDPAEQQAAIKYMQQMATGEAQPGGQVTFGGRPGAGGPGGALMNPQLMQQQLMQMFDKNGNGQLEPDEQQAAAQFVQQQMQGGGQGMGGQGMGGRPGGGKGFGGRPGAGGMGRGGPGGAMMNPQLMQQQLMQKFDKNGNGQLEPDEQQAAAQFVQQRMQMQGGGQGMGGQGMAGQGMGGRPGGGKGFGGRPGAGGPGAGAQGAGGPGAGNGMLSPQMQQQLLQRFDKNGNGQLEPKEQQAAAQFIQQMQAGGGRPNQNN